MQGLPLVARTMVLGTVVAAVPFAALALAQGDPLVVGVYLVLGVVLSRFRVVTPNNLTFSVTILVIFLGLLLHGAPGIVAASIGSGLGSLVVGRRLPPVKAIFNTGQYVLSAALASLVFERAGGVVADPDVVAQIVPVILAVLGYAALNVVFVTMILVATKALQWADVPMLALYMLVFQPLYALFALVGAAVVAATHEVLLVLAIIPMLVVRRSMEAAQEELTTFDRLARTFAKAIEVKDGYTSGHGERVADLSERVGKELRLSVPEVTTVRYAALLHDVGKIGVSLGVLCKNGRLTEEEYEEMKLHPTLGAEILRGVDFLDDCLPVVRHHHERLDGRGYPDGLLGADIPLLTRIVSAVDAFDAMTSTRSYRRAMPVVDAIAELRAHVGTQFDGDVVEALVRVVDRDGWTLTDDRVQVVEADIAPRSVA